MGLFSKKPSRPAFMDWPRENISDPNNTVFVRGVRENQNNIKQFKNAKVFALAVEPQNKYDDKAVMIAAFGSDGLFKVGYLPAGETSSHAMFELTAALELEQMLVVVDGYVERFDDGLGVRLHTPRHSWLKERLQRLNAEKTPTQS